MNTAVEQKKPNAMLALRRDLEIMAPEFAAALPPQISIESFQRVVLTALQTTYGLSDCKPKSIWNACMRAATDGLLPDGREGAIVPFAGEATWIPMVGGIKKKIFQSGKVSTINVEVVRAKDFFDHQEGDGAFISHKKYIGKEDPGEISGVYMIAQMADGSTFREVMSIWEVEQVRKTSKANNSPWGNPVFYPEMIKKTCLKRGAKSLPSSKEMVEFIEREDIEDGITEPPVKPSRPKPTDFTDIEDVSESVDKETGEISKKSTDKKIEPKDDESSTSLNSSSAPERKYSAADAYGDGAKAKAVGKALTDLPTTLKAFPHLAEAWQYGFNSESE
jgi:recombination protein RecT